MLSLAEIRQHLQRITYRPGWTITAYEGRFEGVHLTIRAELEDSSNPGQTVMVDIRSALPPLRDTRALEEWLAWRLGRVESHECREWLHRDGKVIFDPHAPGAERDLD